MLLSQVVRKEFVAMTIPDTTVKRLARPTRIMKVSYNCIRVSGWLNSDICYRESASYKPIQNTNREQKSRWFPIGFIDFTELL